MFFCVFCFSFSAQQNMGLLHHTIGGCNRVHLKFWRSSFCSPPPPPKKKMKEPPRKEAYTRTKLFTSFYMELDVREMVPLKGKWSKPGPIPQMSGSMLVGFSFIPCLVARIGAVWLFVECAWETIPIHPGINHQTTNQREAEKWPVSH